MNSASGDAVSTAIGPTTRDNGGGSNTAPPKPLSTENATADLIAEIGKEKPQSSNNESDLAGSTAPISRISSLPLPPPPSNSIKNRNGKIFGTEEKKDGHKFDGIVAAAATVPQSLTRVTSDQSGARHNLTVPSAQQKYYGKEGGGAWGPVPVRSQSPDPDAISLMSADDFSELRRAESWTSLANTPHHPNSTRDTTNNHGRDNDTAAEEAEDGDEIEGKRSEVRQAPRGFSARIAASWKRNKGLALVLIAQIFGVTMNITTRLLELDHDDSSEGMHPFQILFARMSITCALSSLYMWYNKIPDFPFGAKGVRLLLVCRSITGFWGVFGLYWSLQYLPLADATVLTFLAPIICCWACSKIMHEPFTRGEQIAAFISLAGVVLVARPTSLFSRSSSSTATDEPNSDDRFAHLLLRRAIDTIPEATPLQRLAAVGMSMAGVFGAAGAYTTIRWIGKRAHPLLSVNYFAAWCTIVSTFALTFIPSIPFVLPSTQKQWTLLLLIGISGFVMQFLLTAGLRYEKSSRATNMTYASMLFALAGDKLIWGVNPSTWSIAGSALILGSAIWVALQKEAASSSSAVPKGETVPVDSSGTAAPLHDEERALVGGEFVLGDEDDDDGDDDDDDRDERTLHDVEMAELRK